MRYKTMGSESAASSDLKFLFDREGVAAEVQTGIFDAGISTVRQFAALVPDVAALRKCLVEDFGMSDSNLAGKVAISKVVVVWETAKVRSEKAAEAEAECEVRQEPKPVRNNDYTRMKEAYETKYWKLGNDHLPAKSYLEKISEVVEKAEYRAEPLTEVANKEEDDVDMLRAIWDTSGAIKAVRSYPKVPMPRDPEELRQRITLLGTAWASQPSAAVIQGVTPQTWQRYLEYILGKHCYGLSARNAYGETMAAPPWSLLMSYELEVRRKMAEDMSEGIPMATALEKAYKDPVVKERYFTTPLAAASVTGAKRKVDEAFGNQDAGGPKGRGKGKSKDKGKSKGKGKNGKGCASRTPDGKPICYKYNNQVEKCTKSRCSFLHVCGRCFKDHPMYQCTEA